jgi:hypothetical protein
MARKKPKQTTNEEILTSPYRYKIGDLVNVKFKTKTNDGAMLTVKGRFWIVGLTEGIGGKPMYVISQTKNYKFSMGGVTYTGFGNDDIHSKVSPITNKLPKWFREFM